MILLLSLTRWCRFMQRKDRTVLLKICDEINIALEMIGTDTFESFNENEMKKRAVCMTVINIGELVKNLSADFRLSNDHVPWKLIAGFRDIAAHKYGSLRMEDVYATVTNDFPTLKKNVNEILLKNEY